jgi:hypothetical protein
MVFAWLLYKLFVMFRTFALMIGPTYGKLAVIEGEDVNHQSLLTGRTMNRNSMRNP